MKLVVPSLVWCSRAPDGLERLKICSCWGDGQNAHFNAWDSNAIYVLCCWSSTSATNSCFKLQVIKMLMKSGQEANKRFEKKCALIDLWNWLVIETGLTCSNNCLYFARNALNWCHVFNFLLLFNKYPNTFVQTYSLYSKKMVCFY